MYLVPFISKRWEQLSHSGGTDEQLRIQLEALLDPRDQSTKANQGRIQAFDRIHDFVFHQQSTFPSTYVAVPYLVQSLERFEVTTQYAIVDLVASISCQGDPHGDLRAAELAAYDQSLSLLAEKAERLFQLDGESNERRDTPEALNLLGRLATLRGMTSVGQLLRDNEEAEFTCRHCQRLLQSCGKAITIESTTMDPEKVLFFSVAEPFEPQYALPFARTIVCKDDHELQSTVYSRNFMERVDSQTANELPSVDQHFATVYDLAMQNGHFKIGGWLRHFFGFCHCPDCGHKHDLAASFSTQRQ